MTSKEINEMPKVKRDLFLAATDIVAGFMSSSMAEKERTRSNLIKDIVEFKLESLDNTNLKKNYAGSCRRLVKKSFKNIIIRQKEFLSTIQVDDKKRKTYLDLLRVSMHEVQHAETNRHGIYDSNGTLYCGLVKYKKVNDKIRGIGTGINEAMNEMYTLLGFEERFPNSVENNTSKENILYSYNKPLFRITSLAEDGPKYLSTWPFLKLLIAACDNAPRVKYENIPEGDFVNKIAMQNGIAVVKNDLLKAGKFGDHAINFNKQFDSFCGKNAWDSFLTITDSMFRDVMDKHKAKVLDINYFINTVDKFKDAKIEYMFDRGIWGITDIAEYEAQYDTIRSQIVKKWNINPGGLKKSK